MQIIAIYSKGLAIWPGDSKFVSDQVTCRFIADAKQNITNSDVNSVLVKFEENNFDVVRMDKLYLYDEKEGFFS